MSAGVCTSLVAEIEKLDVDQQTRSKLLFLFLDKANIAAYENKPYSIVDFIAEVKQELNSNVDS